MADLSGYDAEKHEPLSDFTALPKGDYPGIAIDSMMKPTKAGNGSYLELTWEIIDGEHKGRRLWSRLNLDNPNEKAVEIAQRELSSICRAAGVLRPKNSEQLHGIPLTLKVGVEKRQDTGDFTNRIRGYAPLNGSAAPQPQGDGPAKPPWKR